jgi:NADH dehydrogenase/NADH:ubiquinone oxidoreductase subunit G
MIRLIIDGQKVDIKKELTLLDAAKSLDINIPTLCYHPALDSHSACRVCLVEIIEGAKPELVSACSYPVQEGLVVKTNSKRVLKARRFVVELLLARSPQVEKIQELAKKMHIEKSRFEARDEECILCGICTRVCQEIIGRSAISFINRGPERKVETPFEIQSDLCIGCGACSFVCPTGAIKIEELKDKCRISRWHAEFPLLKCKVCGESFAPMAEMEFLKGKIDSMLKEVFELCLNCRRSHLQGKLKEIAATLNICSPLDVIPP